MIRSSEVQGAAEEIGKSISKRVAQYVDRIYYATDYSSKRRAQRGQIRVKSSTSAYRIKGGNIGYKRGKR